MNQEEKLKSFNSKAFALITEHFGPNDGLVFSKRLTLSLQMTSLVKHALDYAYKPTEFEDEQTTT